MPTSDTTSTTKEVDVVKLNTIIAVGLKFFDFEMVA